MTCKYNRVELPARFLAFGWISGGCALVTLVLARTPGGPHVEPFSRKNGKERRRKFLFSTSSVSLTEGLGASITNASSGCVVLAVVPEVL